MSSRGRGPEWDDEEWDDRSRSGRRRPPPPSARTFGLPIVGAALLVGLIIGFIASCGGGGTTTVTETQTVTAPDAASAGAAVPSGAASRATIALAILNGSGENGLAGTRADEARTLGYENVTAADAPSRVSSDRIVYRKGAAARAAQVAQDLGLGDPTLASAGDPLLEAAPDAAVVVVLGPTGGGTTTTPDTGTSTTG